MKQNQLSNLLRLVFICGFLVNWLFAVARAADTATNSSPRLLIVKAVYGDPNDASATVDVTKQITALVKDDAVTIGAGNDNFEDPASGVGKVLKVNYTIDGVAGTKSAFENGVLKLSLKDKPDAAKKNSPPKMVIRKAIYGDLPEGNSFDVTSEVAKLVRDDTLTVTPNGDDFGDPSMGRPKKLRVDYTFDGKEKSKTVAEDQALTISANGE
ncbi:MAG TPA: DUF3395 domain-containing protein [Verrucomicrobiae bacterium]|nr:DUF3395 domain-containing protein [Verrucomicrobiae bacterium]